MVVRRREPVMKKQLYLEYICKKSFDGKPELLTHNSTHTVIKPYDFIVCAKRFSARGSLTSHLNCCHNIKQFGTFLQVLLL